MSQEIVPRSQFALAETDPWATPAPAAAAAPPVSPLRRIHRLLRGRYWLAFTLATLGAVAGAFCGFVSQKPIFRSSGLVEINPIVDTPLQNERVMLMYAQYVQNQIALMQSQNVIAEAVNSEEWKRTGRGNSPHTIAAFASALNVHHIPNTSFIRPSFSDPDPAVAQTAVSCIIRAYEVLYGDKQAEANRRKLNDLDSRMRNFVDIMQRRQKEILEISAAYGTDDLSVFHNSKLAELVKLEAMLEQAKFQLKSMSGALDEDGEQKPLTNEQIAAVDPAMQELLAQKAGMEMQIEGLRIKLGDRHPQVAEARARLDLLMAHIQKTGDAFRVSGKRLVLSPDGQRMEVVSPETLKALETRVAYLQTMYDRLKAETTEIGLKRHRIQTAQNDIERARADYDDHQKRLDQLRYEYASQGRLSIISYGDFPLAPAQDKRKQFAVLGFLGGGMLPVALLVFIGLLDVRYRYSDDTSDDLSGIPLLGILPNLPDLLTDPEQAAVAAHCVHQIRTMLQINAATADGKVFVCTSPSPGDGKTSLTMALGLSFAACGQRTLLIDGDLVGAGLTARMNVVSPTGILEALADRSLLPYVQVTDVQNLMILPVGSAQAHHSSMLSPQIIRKLIAEARDQFDVVLIDTGPILGSIEAAPVASASDGVILVVARGQQRPLVEKSMRHLISIGARLAGVVFNRANPRDFEQSVSRLSMRSVRVNGNGHGGLHEERDRPRLGPVAKAVAKSVTPNEG
jgi:succinoglycan biosynthesis transport protein ExoP